MEERKSVCMFCGVGCRLRYLVEGNKIIRVMPDTEDPASRGKPCIKGLKIGEMRLKRVVSPLVRGSDGLERVDWDYAIEYILQVLDNVDPSLTLWVGSGEITNEDNYLIQKLARSLGSENIDSCARLCHAPTVKVFNEMLGIPASPGYMDDVLEADLVLVAGTNPASNYPALFARMVGKRLAVVSSWLNDTMRFAKLRAVVRPGTILFFLAGILHLLIEKYGLRKDYEGFEELRESVAVYTPERVSELTGERKETLMEFAEAVASAENLAVMHGMKITQTYHGTDGVRVLVAIALLKDGKIVTNRGKINIQGCGDMGVVPGPNGSDMVEGIVTKPLRFAYISIMNPARSLPHLKKAWENMRKMFIVHATPYFNETSEFADVVLPTPLLIEREGTVTTGERRIRRVFRVVDPPPEALEDWRIMVRLAHGLGFRWRYTSWLDAFKEIVAKVEGYKDVDVEAVLRGEDVFADKTIKFKKFIPIRGRVVDYPGYPFRLVTARSYFHFNTGDTTMGVPALRERAEKYFLMNPEDLRELGSPSRVRLSSPVGSIEVEVRADPRVPRRTIVGKFYISHIPVNILVPPDTDPDTGIPPYKAVPVRVVAVEGIKKMAPTY